MPSPVYLDYQATAPLDPRVLDAMLPWMRGMHGNPHSAEHAFGWRANEAITAAQEAIAAAFGAEPRELIFTSGATEANNLAIRNCGVREGMRNTVIVSAVEHPSVLEAANSAAVEGAQIVVCSVDEGGALRMDHLRELLSPRVFLVSVGAVNNEIGTIQDLKEIARLAHEAGAFVHSDCSQAPLAMTVDVAALELDLATFSSHKMHGPMGIGALYVAPTVRALLHPLIVGGAQQRGLRAGTVATALCVGFAEACRLIKDAGEIERARIRSMRDRLRERLISAIAAVRVVGIASPRHPGNLALLLPVPDAREVVQRSQPHVAFATGSACHSGNEQPSHVLTALGMCDADARRVVRLGVGRFTTSDEVDAAADTITRVVREVQETYASELRREGRAAS